ncbi:hypothetical protein IU487_07205 [Nocardia puris]|uniref:hypothetical protein n=1 Tax=Nocardia puris TaxID=208602 RepID=UPI001893E1F0|nr:hypothetical protein [Nocardia puris]MBF6210836.1 hypothetical protein [Nocardia puris]
MTDLDKRAAAPAEPDADWPAPVRAILLVLLTLSGVFTLAFEVLYLPIYLGSTDLRTGTETLVAAPLAAQAGPGVFVFPITALLAGVLNVALVAAARTLTDSLRVALLPVVAWTFAFLACTVAGPGGDLVLMSDWPTLLLLVCGLAPPIAYVYFRVNEGTLAPR